MYDFSIKSNSKFSSKSNENQLIKFQPFHSFELQRAQILSEFHSSYEEKVKELFFTDKPPKDALNRYLHEQLSIKSRVFNNENEDYLLPKPDNELKTLIFKFKSEYPICTSALRHLTHMNSSKFLLKIQPFLQIAPYYNENKELNKELTKFRNNLNNEITPQTVDEYRSLFKSFACFYKPVIDDKIENLSNYLCNSLLELSSKLNQISKNIFMDYDSKRSIEFKNNEIILKELDNFTIELKFNNQSYQIGKKYYEKLKILFEIHNKCEQMNNEQIFLSRIFSLICRYESYFKNSIKLNEGYGLQAALPGVVFKELNKQFEVSEEMFASPFNCYFSNYCSAFVDTDIFFGSHGSFFDYHPLEGSFECNPPFTSEIYSRMIDHIDYLLESSQQPLSFIVFIPERLEGDDPNADKLKKSKFLKKSVIVLYNQHQYVSGAQHMLDKSKDVSINYDPCHNTQIFFLQNKAGNEKWTPSQEKIDAILNKMSNKEQQINSNESNIKRKAVINEQQNSKNNNKRSLISYDDL